MHPQSKQCAECGATFFRPAGRSAAQWAKMRCCKPACANALRARGRLRELGDLTREHGKVAYQLEWQRRKTMPQWAAWWEQQRLREDLAEFKREAKRIHGPLCWIKDKPQIRAFTGGQCQACGEPWLYYAKRAQSPYCAMCAATRRRRPGGWRAQQLGALREPIIPRKVFERDNWRCQICGRKTKGDVPALRAPTLDHIVPLSCGGAHVYANLQCACYHCNCFVKRDQSLNDQLRLVG